MERLFILSFQRSFPNLEIIENPKNWNCIISGKISELKKAKSL